MSKIILLEQTKVLKTRLERILKNLGYQEIVNYNEELQSIEKFFTSHVGFISIIINIDQFREDFEKIIDLIKENNEGNSIRIVLLSEKTTVKDITNFFANGVDEIVVKPFNDEEVIKKLMIETSVENQKNIKLVKKKIESRERILSWCSDYEIGVEKIDKEHREIIEHFEKLYELMKDGSGHEYYKELIKFLEYYVNHHFENEEYLQKKVGYKDYEKHKRIHNEFKKQVDTLMSNYDQSDVTNADLIKLNLFIKNWLSDHILVEDKKIGDWIERN